MRPSINQFVGITARRLTIAEPIYEFGAYQVTGQEHIADLRPYFPGKEYIGSDMREGPGVDVILNLHSLDLPDASVGTALMLDTLEHVEYPRRAMDEVYRVLKPGGLVVMSSVMKFHIHDYPDDYWRFTPEAFRSLLKPFSQSFVTYAGEDIHPHTVVGVGVKNGEVDLAAFTADMEDWQQQWFGKTAWKEAVKAFIPPIVLTIVRRLRKSLRSG